MNKIKKVLSVVMVLSMMLCSMSLTCVKAHAASMVEPTNEYGETYEMKVTVDELNIRTGPSTSYTAIDSISYGATVLPIGDNDYAPNDKLWYYIQYKDNGRTKVGWIKAIIDGEYTID